MLHFFNVPGTRKIHEKKYFLKMLVFVTKKSGEVSVLGGPICMEVSSLLTVEAGPSLLSLTVTKLNRV